MEVQDTPISVSHILENIYENFCCKTVGEPVLVHINLSKMSGIFPFKYSRREI